MSLPGRWTDEPAVVPSPQKPVKKQSRPFQVPNYTDPAVTQFCNENLKDLDDLQNVDQLIASLTEQQNVVTAKVFPTAESVYR